MSFHPPAVDTTSAMYQARKRAKREHAPLAIAPAKAAPNGSHEEKQAWMRQRQYRHADQLREANATPTRREWRLADENQRLAAVEGRREAQLLAEAESEVQKRHIARCEAEIALYRMLPESETEKAYRPAMGEADWHAERRLIEKSAS
jgi:hypothetical protein